METQLGNFNTLKVYCAQESKGGKKGKMKLGERGAEQMLKGKMVRWLIDPFSTDYQPFEVYLNSNSFLYA